MVLGVISVAVLPEAKVGSELTMILIASYLVPGQATRTVPTEPVFCTFQTAPKRRFIPLTLLIGTEGALA